MSAPEDRIVLSAWRGDDCVIVSEIETDPRLVKRQMKDAAGWVARGLDVKRVTATVACESMQRVIKRDLATAMEARSGETPLRLDPKGDSAVPEGQAPR